MFVTNPVRGDTDYVRLHRWNEALTDQRHEQLVSVADEHGMRHSMNDIWIEPEETPALQDGEVHVWLVHVPSARVRLNDLAALLSADERERAARFRFERHRERAQVARGVLRSLLGHYTRCDAAAIRFAYNPHGKPELTNSNLYSNTSHSGDYAVFAFTRAGVVGVDIEQIHGDMSRHEAIAQRFFAPGEQQQLNSLPKSERARGFFHLWTGKEAFVKARGDGLFSGLDQFETALDGSRILSIHGAPARDWWMSALPNVPDYAGAVVVNASDCAPRFLKWK